MDSVGRPVDGGATDHQEIQRRYDVENPDDVNYALQQRRDDGQQGNGENLDPNDKVAYIKGEKTICCWNCQSILMVKDEWSVVQCTQCEKINKVPGSDDINKQIRLNDNLNHFDIHLPYVYVILTCPFCRTENKARKDAEHVVCYKCHNSVSIFHDNKNKVSSSTNNMNTNPYDHYTNPPNKSMRANDMFFPQPGQYNNFNPYAYPYPPHLYPPFPYPPMPDLVDRQMENYLRMEMLQKKLERNEPKPSRYGALRDLISTVDHINNTRSNGATPEMGGNKFRDHQNKKFDNFDGRSLVSPLRNESVYKSMFLNNNYKSSYDPYDSYQDFKKNNYKGKLDLNSRDYVLK